MSFDGLDRHTQEMLNVQITELVLRFILKKKKVGDGRLLGNSGQVRKRRKYNFIGLPYRSHWESNMEYRLFAKAGEGGSQVLQMKQGETAHFCTFLQINSLDFNTIRTNRKGTCEHITVKSEVIFHPDVIAKGQLRQQEAAPRHLGFGWMDAC